MFFYISKTGEIHPGLVFKVGANTITLMKHKYIRVALVKSTRMDGASTVAVMFSTKVYERVVKEVHRAREVESTPAIKPKITSVSQLPAQYNN